MKPRRYDLIMAFYPHARGLAYVIFEGPLSPVDWGMSDIAGAQKARRCLQRLALLLTQYRPDALVLRGVSHSAGTKQGAKLLGAMETLAEREGIYTAAVSRKQIQAAFASLGSPTRYAIVEAIAKHIRVLAPFVPPPRKIWNGEDRRMGLFDAAAMALTFYQSSGQG
jgi:hypothetical protein